MRLAALILCLVTFSAVPLQPLLGNSKILPDSLQFDFGRDVPAAPGYVRISPANRYTPGMPFGLLSDSLAPVDRRSLGKVVGPQAADGLGKQGPIDFRIDLPPGRYVVEVTMDGGSLETWHGEISVNGQLLASTLQSFGYSAEATYAPPFWTCLRMFENRADHVMLRIAARGQRTTVNALSFFPYVEGAVQWSNGAFLRTTSAKAPNMDLAIRLINAGEVTEAARIIDAIPPEWNVDRAYLLMALASKLETQTPRALVESAQALLSSEYARTQDPSLKLQIRLTELYLLADRQRKQAGWQWARDLNGMGIFGNSEIAGNCWTEAASLPNHPLWLGSAWQLARTCYWLWREQHVHHTIARADSLFRLIQKFYPADPLLNVYLADAQPRGPVTVHAPGVPRWAELQNSLANKLKGVIHYWCASRQAENGEFGGKYDDDVEMLRWWPFARVGMDDSLTLVGMKRLADGIWNSSWIANGWCKEVRDVEHSSEPVADTQPMMIAFEYGNPVYVERCMQSVKLALDLWTAKNARGHRHFRSGWYSSTRVDDAEPKDCDVPYNTRTVKAIRWFAWYTRHPEAMRFLREWADSWLEDCDRTDKGKPVGVVPAAVRFSDDAIGGHADNWHHPGLFWDYFDYDGEEDMLMEFLSCYQLFGHRKYLKPIEASLDLVRKHAPDDTREAVIGSEAWAAGKLRRSNGFWEVVEIWRLLTGNTAFDSLLMQKGSPYLRYRLTSDMGAMNEKLAGLLGQADAIHPLLTTEGYFTDRIQLRDPRGPDENSASLLESMYLGAPLVSLFYPSGAVLWKQTDSTFSALVEASSPRYLRIRVFNHGRTAARVVAGFTQLEPGEYTIVQGKDTNGDGDVEQTRNQEVILLSQRNTLHSFMLAPREEELIVLRQKKAGNPAGEACDLAITRAELKMQEMPGGKIAVTLPIHNIGTVEARDITAELRSVSEPGTVLGSVKISRLAAPLDLVPRIENVSFGLPSRRGAYTVTVKARPGQMEITDVNNRIEFTLQ